MDGITLRGSLCGFGNTTSLTLQSRNNITTRSRHAYKNCGSPIIFKCRYKLVLGKVSDFFGTRVKFVIRS